MYDALGMHAHIYLLVSLQGTGPSIIRTRRVGYGGLIRCKLQKTYISQKVVAYTRLTRKCVNIKCDIIKTYTECGT